MDKVIKEGMKQAAEFIDYGAILRAGKEGIKESSGHIIKKGLKYGAGGAVIGAGVNLARGEDVGEGAVRGATIGGAAGLATGAYRGFLMGKSGFEKGASSLMEASSDMANRIRGDVIARQQKGFAETATKSAGMRNLFEEGASAVREGTKTISSRASGLKNQAASIAEDTIELFNSDAMNAARTRIANNKSRIIGQGLTYTAGGAAIGAGVNLARGEDVWEGAGQGAVLGMGFGLARGTYRAGLAGEAAFGRGAASTLDLTDSALSAAGKPTLSSRMQNARHRSTDVLNKSKGHINKATQNMQREAKKAKDKIIRSKGKSAK